MIVFAASAKGGTGRSVACANIVYRSALQGSDACYLDFDFGSPSSGAIFSIQSAARGIEGGLHSYLYGAIHEPRRLDVWSEADRASLRERPAGAGRLVVVPGDRDGGEFPLSPEMIDRCALLFLLLEEEFDLTVVDLSAGRSYASELVLAATAVPALRPVRCRWLVFQRWTRQHVLATADLVHGHGGILDIGARLGHDPVVLEDSLRLIRTASVDPASPELAGLTAAQVSWLRECDRDLLELASERRVGRSALLADVPLDPLLQWREQLVSDDDVSLRKIANPATAESFRSLAKTIADDAAWEIS